MAVQSCAWRGSRRLLLRGTAAALLNLGVRPLLAANGTPEDWTVVRAKRGTRGPTIRVKRGEEVRVRLVNDLTEPTALHWHGVRLPNGMDGVPGLTQEPVRPGARFDYRFTPPDAGTSWYGPSVTTAGEQLGGAFGALIVDGAEPAAADRDELLLLGDVPDGLPPPDFAVRQNERLRLRLVNAGPGILPLNLSPHRPWVMAIDGQPADPFTARDGRIVLGPGNRVDAFIDATLEPGSMASIAVESPHGRAVAARLVYDLGAPVRAAPLPEPKPLPGNGLPERIDLRNAVRVEFRVTGSVALEDRLFGVKRGRSVVLALRNESALPYAVHLHGHHCRLLDALDDGWKPFWLDTILVGPQNISRVAFVADNPGKWLIEARRIGATNPIRTAWFEIT
jgi:FtsP/CotA-like multicopper oxidase with cupredoxin domain